MSNWFTSYGAGRKRMTRYLVPLSAICLLLCGFAVAQEPQAADDEADAKKISWGYEADYNGKYVWHGIAYSQGAVLQPSVWATAGTATVTAWANRTLEAVDGASLNEVDYTLSWESNWRDATIEPSLQVYTYPGQVDSPSTAEAGLKITWPVGRFSLFTTQTVDITEYAGAYFGDIGMSYEKELHPNTGMECSASLGWASAKFNETYIGPHISALNVASLDIGLTHTVKSGFYLRPHVSFTRILNGTLRDAVDDPDIVNLGIAVGMEF